MYSESTKNIEVIEPIIVTEKTKTMSTETEKLDLSKLSDSDMKAELKRREALKKEERNAYKELADETVTGVFNDLIEASGMLRKAKVKAFTDLKDLLKMKIDVYGIKDGQQSHTFSTKDNVSITIGFRQTDGWDDTVASGIAKVNAYIQSLAKDPESATLVKTIQRLLKKDAKNNLKANRVIELKGMAEEFNNQEFSDGVDIILSGYKPIRSCYFIEASMKSENGENVPVPLSISAVDFPKDMDLTIFNI
jgi:hypothetical protein